jgi:tetratricopeptide (TPR) repeat protein
MRQYGYAAHLLGNSKVALETYKKLEANGFDNYESALIIGYSLLKLDSAWNARPYLRKAVEKRKEGEYASLLHLGNAYIACGEYGEGIGCLYEVIETITPKNDLYYSLYNSIGEAYYKQKIYEKAAKAFLECTKYKSDNPLVYYNIAQMCKGLKDEKREMRFSKKFLDISHHLEDTPQNKELIQSVEERVEYLSKHATK